MRLLRVLLALGLVVCVSRGGEILTEAEETIKDAEVVSVSTTDVVYKVNGKEVTKKIGDIRKIDLRDPERVLSDKKYSQIDLTDGTSLVVSAWSIKGKTLEMKLMSGPSVKLPLDTVNGILNTASEDKDRGDWRNRVINTRGKEAVVMKKIVTRYDKKLQKEVEVIDENTGRPQTVTFNLPAKIGDGDEKGETIEAAVVLDEKTGAEKKTFKQKDLHGYIWPHTLPAKSPAVICKLTDTIGNAVMVSKLEKSDGGVTVTTPSGAKMDFTLAQISQIDYSRGRFDYLSALVPEKTTITLPSFDEKDKLKTDYKWFVYKDSNLDLKPIKLGGTSYRYGLTLLPDVELQYDLGGNYRQFDAVIGIDDETKAEGEVKLEIWGDNRKLDTIEVSYRTEKGKGGDLSKPARPAKKLTLNVKDVTTLKIIMKSKDELNGLSFGLSLGDAKVTR